MSIRDAIDEILHNTPSDKVQNGKWDTVQDAVESFSQHVPDNVVSILQGDGQIYPEDTHHTS